MASDEQCLSLNLHKLFLKDALKHLCQLKSTLAELKKLKNEYKTLGSSSEKSCVLTYANKLKDYIERIKLDIDNTHSSYVANYEKVKNNQNALFQTATLESELTKEITSNNGNSLNTATPKNNSDDNISDDETSVKSTFTHNTEDNSSENEDTTPSTPQPKSKQASTIHLDDENRTISEDESTRIKFNKKIAQLNEYNQEISTEIKNKYSEYFTRTAIIKLTKIDVSNRRIVTNFNSETNSSNSETTKIYDSDKERTKMSRRFFKKLELTDKSSLTSDSDEKNTKRRTRSERNKIRVNKYVTEDSDTDFSDKVCVISIGSSDKKSSDSNDSEYETNKPTRNRGDKHSTKKMIHIFSSDDEVDAIAPNASDNESNNESNTGKTKKEKLTLKPSKKMKKKTDINKIMSSSDEDSDGFMKNKKMVQNDYEDDFNKLLMGDTSNVPEKESKNKSEELKEENKLVDEEKKRKVDDKINDNEEINGNTANIISNETKDVEIGEEIDDLNKKCNSERKRKKNKTVNSLSLEFDSSDDGSILNDIDDIIENIGSDTEEMCKGTDEERERAKRKKSNDSEEELKAKKKYKASKKVESNEKEKIDENKNIEANEGGSNKNIDDENSDTDIFANWEDSEETNDIEDKNKSVDERKLSEEKENDKNSKIDSKKNEELSGDENAIKQVEDNVEGNDREVEEDKTEIEKRKEDTEETKKQNNSEKGNDASIKSKKDVESNASDSEENKNESEENITGKDKNDSRDEKNNSKENKEDSVNKNNKEKNTEENKKKSNQDKNDSDKNTINNSEDEKSDSVEKIDSEEIKDDSKEIKNNSEDTKRDSEKNKYPDDENKLEENKSNKTNDKSKRSRKSKKYIDIDEDSKSDSSKESSDENLSASKSVNKQVKKKKKMIDDGSSNNEDSNEKTEEIELENIDGEVSVDKTNEGSSDSTKNKLKTKKNKENINSTSSDEENDEESTKNQSKKKNDGNASNSDAENSDEVNTDESVKSKNKSKDVSSNQEKSDEELIDKNEATQPNNSLQKDAPSNDEEQSNKENILQADNETTNTEDNTNEKEATANANDASQESETKQLDESDIKKELDESETKRPFLKCIDINKLLDPNKLKQQEESITKGKKETRNTRNKIDSKSVIVLSSCSDSEEVVKKKEHKDILKKIKKNKDVTITNISKVVSISSDESDSDRPRFRRRAAQTNATKNRFAQLRNLRKSRMKIKSLKDISSESSSDSSEDSRKKKTMNITLSSDSGSNHSSDSDSNNKKSKNKKHTKKFVIDPNYDYKNDIKFKVHCYISLPRRTPEELLKNYLDDLEYRNIRSLTNTKSLKRNRKPNVGSDESSSSISSTTQKSKKDKKRNKQTEKVDSDDGMNSDVDGGINSSGVLDNIELPTTNGNHAPSPDIFFSDNEKGEEMNASGSEDETKKKEKPKEKTNKEKTNKENKSEKSEANNGNEDEANGSDSDDVLKKNKSKWRNNKLLRTKITETDSEEEEIRFQKKKSLQNVDDDDDDNRKSDADVIVVSSTKKNKRKKRRLGSESDNSSCSDKSSGEVFQKKKSTKGSDSDSEDVEKKKKVRKRIKRMKASDDSSDDGQEKKDDKTRKKIRNVWNHDKLADTTKAAEKEEEERKKRIAERQKLYNQMFDKDLPHNAKVDKIVLDFDEETKEELLSVDPALVSKLKPHQASGIQFMWTSCFESLERAKSTEGSGCILAHCMGLGKTLQVIALIHTLVINYEKTGIRTVLVVCPLSTVLNWVSEFKKWLDDLDGEQVNVFDLVSYKQPRERLFQIKDWQKYGGVLVMGYDMFRNLSNPKGKRQSKKLTAGYNAGLVDPGPDLVICDEGHLLKNEKTGISIAMNRLRTKRRIVLTGTPLQNNLKEYYCMVQFVKPNLLGTYKEYLNRFVNPITNGQYTDSTERDIHIMRRRSHVLHKMLDGIVERRDYGVLAPFLPPKHEYVLFITLTPIQIALYKEYLQHFSRRADAKGMSYLFQDFQELQRICIHPRVLLDKSNLDKLKRDKEDEDSEGSLRDFIDDGDEESMKSTSSNESSDDSDASVKHQPTVSRRKTRANPTNIEDEPEIIEQSEPEQWWQKFCQDDELDNIKHSSKILLLFEILHQCELIGDKVLVFSQSLFSLNLIEYFLGKIDEATQNSEKSDLLGGYEGSWSLGLDYFRLDGSTSCDKRATWCKLFNSENNTRARLFLISTRAGGLGINLVAANRVIIFDVSWNPSHDIQSIYRVYRFGQTKPCYIYRFVTLGTMENKIYERQVTKQAISKRVIDEQQIDRHYNQNDLAELYAFSGEPTEERPTPMVPKDRLFADLLQSHEKNIFKYHEHNSLLENKEDETLNEEERKAAWEEFENEKKNIPKFDLYQTMMNNGMIETLRAILQKDSTYSQLTAAQLNSILPSIINMINQQVSMGDFTMYHKILEEHRRRLVEKKQIELQYQQMFQQMSSGYANPGMLQQYFKNSPLQQFPNNQPGIQGTSGSVYNPFAQGGTNVQTRMNNATITGDVVEIDD